MSVHGSTFGRTQLPPIPVHKNRRASLIMCVCVYIGTKHNGQGLNKHTSPFL